MKDPQRMSLGGFGRDEEKPPDLLVRKSFTQKRADFTLSLSEFREWIEDEFRRYAELRREV